MKSVDMLNKFQSCSHLWYLGFAISLLTLKICKATQLDFGDFKLTL